jgi:hypothetical protein
MHLRLQCWQVKNNETWTGHNSEYCSPGIRVFLTNWRSNFFPAEFMWDSYAYCIKWHWNYFCFPQLITNTHRCSITTAFPSFPWGVPLPLPLAWSWARPLTTYSKTDTLVLILGLKLRKIDIGKTAVWAVLWAKVLVKCFLQVKYLELF